MKLFTALLMGGMTLASVAHASEVMPDSPPMTQAQMSSVLDALAQFVPVGQSAYQGHNSQGQPCSMSSDLEHSAQSGSFDFVPGARLAFVYPAPDSADAVQFFLIDQTLTTSPDGQQKSLHLVLDNRGGFGPDRVIAYDLTATQGHLTSFRASIGIIQGALAPGESIDTFVPTVSCSF